MNPSHPASNQVDREVAVTRISDTQWQAVADDQVVGCGDASRRPDGRLFVSVDVWQDADFDLVATAMLADLAVPLYTVVDEADPASTAAWQRVGFAVERREWGYVVPTDPQVTGLGEVQPPAGVTVLPAGEAQEAPLLALDRVVRDEVEASVGWCSMPAEVLPRPAGTTVVDSSQYAVARQGDEYVGLIRVKRLPRQPRIGLVAVRADQHRRGVARALLAHALGELHRSGTATAWAEVTETNTAATALFEGIGARRSGSTLELVRR
ncbi:GNAT family N-acetyltransferase [Kitasatospora sp. NPDC004745]|uniref:GNAT family N-acetyltransferase n=1 Tax=unclassified Kitasatospora TaxID=2633591 RepID=UPI0033C4C567